MTKVKQPKEPRKGAVLNLIMRKMLGEDEVIALKKEVAEQKEKIECLRDFLAEVVSADKDNSDNPLLSVRKYMNNIAQASHIVMIKKDIASLRKDLDDLRSFLINNTDLMVEKFEFKQVPTLVPVKAGRPKSKPRKSKK